MAQRILIRQGKQPNEKEVNEVAKVFRHRVSLEGIYYLHDFVNDNQSNTELRFQQLEGIVEQQKDKLNQQMEEMNHQKEEISQQKEEISQQKEEISQQKEEISQQKEEISQQKEEII